MLTARRGWTAQGTALFLGAMTTDLDRATALPGWTGRHLLAHVAANAEALGNLVTWARTGVETPMYSSPGQRAADIATGARRGADELRTWVADSAAALDDGLDRLGPADWERPVRTAQGRTVPASEIPWLRAREVLIHAVDLDAGVAFEDLPPDFLAALVDDIVGKRSTADGPALALTAAEGTWTVTGTGPPTAVTATLAGIAAYLAGRRTLAGAPTLPSWL